MRSHVACPDQCPTQRRSGCDHRVGEDTLILKHEGHLEGKQFITHNYWNDRSGSISNIKSVGLETLHHFVCVLPELFPSFRFLVYYVQGSTDSCNKTRCKARGEDHGAAGVLEKFNDLP